MSSGFFLLGILIGAAAGYFLYELRSLAHRITTLEQQQAPERPVVAEPERTEITAPVVDVEPELAREQKDQIQPESVRLSRADRPLPPLGSGTSDTVPNPWVEKLKEWFTTGNVPVKVGVIVSFFGVAFLLKYAVDRNLLNVPMWLRLVFAALFGVVLLIVGWRLRHRMRVYALSLQGGGVGIIYLTVFAAFRLYGLLPPVPAFVLLALITVPAATLAVIQDARVMAVFALTGGFLAPVLASTGQGSHVALFSYYLLLNLAIIGIAWYKSWRELNLLGFLFTFVIGSIWGYKFYRTQYFATAEAFLIAHFLLYQAAAILFAHRQPPRLRGIVDGTLIFGTPVIAIALQAGLFRNSEYGLAFSAAALAIFYALMAWWLHTRDKSMQFLRDSYIALSVAFATVAVPLAFDARWTSATWAMEGSALVWLSVRQSSLLSRFAGVALILLAGSAFLTAGWDNDVGLTVLNRNVLGGTLISLAGFFSARQLQRIDHSYGQWASAAMLIWGMGWWVATGLLEIDDRVRHSMEYPVIITFIVLSAVALSFLGRRLSWSQARFGSLVMLPLLFVTLLGRSVVGGHPLESFSTVPWLLAGAAHFYILKPFAARSWLTAVWHVAGVLIAAWLLVWEIDWWIVVETWSNAASSMLLTVLAGLCWLARPLFAWPLRQEQMSYIIAAGVLLAVNLLFILAFSLDTPGDPLPLPYLPVLNPYDLITLAALATGFVWINETSEAFGNRRWQPTMLSVLGIVAFVLTTLGIVRGVHHYAQIPWRQYSLSQSVEVQSALSIYWGLLGFGGMVLGARRNLRWLWLIGSALMALVVIKLFLIDLGNSGTVARIVSFIGVGALLLVVGYFAPVPPRQDGAVKNEG